MKRPCRKCAPSTESIVFPAVCLLAVWTTGCFAVTAALDLARLVSFDEGETAQNVDWQNLDDFLPAKDFPNPFQSTGAIYPGAPGLLGLAGAFAGRARPLDALFRRFPWFPAPTRFFPDDVFLPSASGVLRPGVQQNLVSSPLGGIGLNVFADPAASAVLPTGSTNYGQSSKAGSVVISPGTVEAILEKVNSSIASNKGGDDDERDGDAGSYKPPSEDDLVEHISNVLMGHSRDIAAGGNRRADDDGGRDQGSAEVRAELLDLPVAKECDSSTSAFLLSGLYWVPDIFTRRQKHDKITQATETHGQKSRSAKNTQTQKTRRAKITQTFYHADHKRAKTK
jgi:hypothetical protein